MNEDLIKITKKAADLVLSYPKDTRIRVISHYDADGISAAAIISKALYRLGYDFHTTLMRNPFDKGLKRVSKEDNEIIIFSDMGSGQIDTIQKMNVKSIIFDHHQVKKEKTDENIIQINCNLFSINGNYEACGSTLAYLFTKALDQNNIDLSGIAITGMTGDKQYIGGFRGLNKEIIDEAVKNNIVTEKTAIKLPGETIFDSLYYSVDPYYSGISGNKEQIKNLLDTFEIDKNKRYQLETFK